MYDDSNIFARIIRGELPCDTVYEDNDTLAFRDINPVAPVHVLVVPKSSYVSFDDFAMDLVALGRFFSVVRKVVDLLDLKGGYRLVSNHGADSGQLVDHFHVHIIGGRKLGAIA